MNFGELRFWIILFGGLGMIVAMRPVVMIFRRSLLQWYDKTALFLLGLFMLGVVSWVTLVIFITVVLTTYFGLLAINRKGHGSVHWLWLLVPLQLAPLLYYKYSRFLAVEVFQREWTFLDNIAIPVGISFYLYQLVSL